MRSSRGRVTAARRPAVAYLLITGWALLAPAGSSRAAENTGSPWVAEYNVSVRMSDGVELSTDIYRPAGEKPVAVLLVRTPYNNGGELRVLERARAVVQAGLAFVQQDVRGRHDSGGQWVPFNHEGRDGHETVEWIARQPWSDGRVITEGGSYMAHVQWLAAAWRSPHLVAMMPRFSPLAIYEDGHRGGAFELTRIKWATLMDGRTQQTLDYDWPRVLRHLPVVEMDRAANHQVLPFWRGIIGHPEKDAFWSGGDATPALERIEIPVMLAGGWYDPFLSSTLLGFTGPDRVWNANGPEGARRLVIGPWRHGGNGSSKTGAIDFGPQAAVDLDAMNLRFAANVLHSKGGGTANDTELPAPLRIFVMGENRWREERDWPLARAKATPFYFASSGRANTLGGDGVLTWKQSPASAPPDRFVYDPLDPVPTRGGNLPGATPDEPPGPFDQREIEQRKDVLVYTSEPLGETLEVTGPLEVVLWASSDSRDTDFTAKLVDVAPDGTAINLADGAVRARYRDSVTAPTLIEPGAVNRYRIDLVATSNVFLPGHRVRVEISSSNFPRFDRNPNTGEQPGSATETRPAAQIVYHDAERPSHIVLPMVPRASLGQ